MAPSGSFGGKLVSRKNGFGELNEVSGLLGVRRAAERSELHPHDVGVRIGEKAAQFLILRHAHDEAVVILANPQKIGKAAAAAFGRQVRLEVLERLAIFGALEVSGRAPGCKPEHHFDNVEKVADFLARQLSYDCSPVGNDRDHAGRSQAMENFANSAAADPEAMHQVRGDKALTGYQATLVKTSQNTSIGPLERSEGRGGFRVRIPFAVRIRMSLPIFQIHSFVPDRSSAHGRSSAGPPPPVHIST